MIKKILLGLVAIVAIIIIASRFQPDSYTVARSAVIEAPPDVVYTHLNDFRLAEQFNPFLDLDPDMAITFKGAESGVGAEYHWSGNKEAGIGSMTIVESRPYELIRMDMHFIEPFEDQSTVAYAMKPVVGGTEVTWSMDGDHNFISKIMCLFMSMDKMIGPKYEEGLQRMAEILPHVERETVASDAGADVNE